MAIDREGTSVEVGDLVEIFGKRASGRLVIAVADAGVYVEDQIKTRPPIFLRDADRCYTSLGRAL